MWTYSYNLDNQLISANKTGSTNSLTYDGAGRLRQTTLAGTVTGLTYEGVDLVAEYNSGGTLLRRYVHGPGVDEPLVWYEGTTTTSYGYSTQSALATLTPFRPHCYTASGYPIFYLPTSRISEITTSSNRIITTAMWSAYVA